MARGRFTEHPAVPGLRVARGAAGPFDPVAHAPADRRRDAPSGVHVGVAAAGGRPSGEGAHHWDRRDDTRSQRGDAEHRAAGHGRRVRGVADPARRGVRYRHADAGRAGPIRSHAEEEGIQQRLDAPRRSGREDHADEGRPDPFGSQSRGGGGPGDRGHRRRHRARRRRRRYDDHDRDPHHGRRTGRSGPAGGDWPGRGRGGQGVSQ